LDWGINLYGYVHDSNCWVDVFGLSVAYEVDTYDNLKAKDVVKDKLGTHHLPQKALAKTTVSGYPHTANAGAAPAIRLPDAEHATITKLQSQNKVIRSQMNAHQLLHDDIKMLQTNTNAPQSAVNKLINMNETMYGITY